MSDSNPGIWGNKECISCGACCYENFGKLCNYQKIRDNKSFCKIYDERPGMCSAHFCGHLETEEEREEYRRIAREILHTAPEKVGSAV